MEKRATVLKKTRKSQLCLCNESNIPCPKMPFQNLKIFMTIGKCQYARSIHMMPLLEVSNNRSSINKMNLHLKEYWNAPEIIS